MSDEREDPRGAVPEPTTMRLQAVQGTEPVETVHESDHVLTKADHATVEALRPGTALLVVQRGPNAGTRFLLDNDEVDVRPSPRQRHLPRRRHRVAQARRFLRQHRRVRGARRRLPQRHLRQPRAHRRGRAPTGDEVQIGKFRSSSTRATQAVTREPSSAEVAGGRLRR